jgi:N-dimethylarginine dimethylaminohydrolase
MLYLMSPPGPTWHLRGRANFRSETAQPVDAAKARQEWLGLARAIEARGGQVVALPPSDPTLTGLPYAAECGHVLPASRGGKPRFLLPRMRAEHRRGERACWAPLAEALGFEVVDPLAQLPDGEHWEAQGDVAECGGVTLLFFGGRTTRAGMEAAAAHFDGEVLRLEIREPAFHGNMALLPVPAIEKLLVCREVMSPASFAALSARFGASALFEVTEQEIRSYATNGLPVGRSLLAPSLAPARVLGWLEQQGMEVVRLHLDELCGKAGGASRCLVSVADVVARVPEAYTLSAAARGIEGA